MRATPYAVPAASAVIAEPWTRGGRPVGRIVSGWDYEAELTFERSVRVDLDAVVQEAGLDGASSLGLHVRYWTRAALVRSSSTTHQLPKGGSGWVDVRLIAPVSCDGFAGELVLETTLVRLDDGDGRPFTARRAGSVLWRDTQVLALEGDGGLLPVAPVRFGQQGLPGDAAWYISLDGTDWSAPAMGSLLVLLNVDNRSVAKALEPGDDPETSLLWDALMVDVVCDLVRRALDDEEFVPVTGEEDELSTGGLVTRLIRSFLRLPAEDVADAVERLRQQWARDPSKVRAFAQSALRFPRGGAS